MKTKTNQQTNKMSSQKLSQEVNRLQAVFHFSSMFVKWCKRKCAPSERSLTRIPRWRSSFFHRHFPWKKKTIKITTTRIKIPACSRLVNRRKWVNESNPFSHDPSLCEISLFWDRCPLVTIPSLFKIKGKCEKLVIISLYSH